MGTHSSLFSQHIRRAPSKRSLLLGACFTHTAHLGEVCSGQMRREQQERHTVPVAREYGVLLANTCIASPRTRFLGFLEALHLC